MHLSQLVRQKLSEFGLDQRALADAAEVTESYISQLLSGKKMPPAPDRTDIYDKLGRFLKLPACKLADLAEAAIRNVDDGRWWNSAETVSRPLRDKKIHS